MCFIVVCCVHVLRVALYSDFCSEKLEYNVKEIHFILRVVYSVIERRHFNKQSMNYTSETTDDDLQYQLIF